MLGALDSSTKLVDVRSPQEFSGELIAMAGYEGGRAALRPHPGAASVPWAQAVQEDGTFKSADELRELYSGKARRTATRSSPTPDRRAPAHTWFVLHDLGQDDVKNYDGSWTEWGTWWTCRSTRTSSTGSKRPSRFSTIRAVAPQTRCPSTV